MNESILESLRNRLEWDEIAEVATEEFREFQVRPTDGDDYIQFLFYPIGDSFFQLGFRHFEWDFEDGYGDANLDAAIDAARDLINQRIAVFEELDQSGWMLVTGLIGRDETPKVIDRRTAQYLRRYFGQPPLVEKIDFSRYYPGKYRWFERAYRDEMKEKIRQLDIDPTVFD